MPFKQDAGRCLPHRIDVRAYLLMRIKYKLAPRI